jgi:hypothetical protein
MRDCNWKYIKNEDGQYLFDLSKDPGEKQNLAMGRSEKIKKILQDFVIWEGEVTGTN